MNDDRSSNPKARKPTPREAMCRLLTAMREQLPLYAPEASLCQKSCVGCPKKLMQYIEGEYEYWQQEVDSGGDILLGDINRLARSSRKIQAVLTKNGIINTRLE